MELSYEQIAALEEWARLELQNLLTYQEEIDIETVL